MSHELTAVLFGMLAAVLWGAGDFSGGTASKRTHVFVVLIISQVIGLVLMIVLALLNRETVPPISSLVWACAAGISGGIGVAALYRALAIGQMGIAAPIAAVFTAAIPVLVSLVTEGLPSVLQLIGFVLALVGVWILSQHKGASGNRRGIWLAVLAGFGFGMLLVGLDRAGGTGSV
jgi:drug/metabolite transporter (DMT)-like permease